MSENRLLASPHIRGEESTRSLMVDVIVALSPAYLWGIYTFGLRALVIAVLSILSCGAAEWGMQKLFHTKGSLSDLSFAVTALILAAALPVSIPLYLVPIGALLAVCLFKHLFGGLGKNLVNPALAALCLLHLFFPEEMTRFTLPFVRLAPFSVSVEKQILQENLSSGALFGQLKEGAFPQDVTISQMLTGSVAGGIASSGVMLLLAGLIYLLVRRVISWQIPVMMTVSAGALYALFPLGFSDRVYFASFALVSGVFIFAAVFAATDPVTSPMTGKGKFCYGILLGALTVIFRYFTSFEDGVFLAVLAGSLTARFWDFLFRPRVYGRKRHLFRSLCRLPEVLKGEFWYFKKRLQKMLSSLLQWKKRLEEMIRSLAETKKRS